MNMMMTRRLALVVTLVAGLVFVGYILTLRAANHGQEATQPQTEQSVPEPGTIPGDAELIVGTDIQPGTYRSDGPSGRLPSCFVQRYADLAMDQALSTVPAKGQAILTVKPTDALVVLTGCEPFVKVG